jgi:Ca2+-binding RTX toxin-like protein
MSGVKVLCRVLGSLALGTSMLIMGGLTAHAGTCLGTSGDDNLMCSSGDDYMDGFGGNDTMSGLGGYDEMHGSGGVDFLHGNSGNDTMYGEAGGDAIVGDSGNDALHDTNASDSDYVCGLGGSDDEIWVNDGDPNDIVYELYGVIHAEAADSIHGSETLCP